MRDDFDEGAIESMRRMVRNGVGVNGMAGVGVSRALVCLLCFV